MNRQIAQSWIRLLLNPTVIRVRALTNSGNHTCATHGTGMRNKTSRSLREVGQRQHINPDVECRDPHEFQISFGCGRIRVSTPSRNWAIPIVITGV
jgi:hypothetical protein